MKQTEAQIETSQAGETQLDGTINIPRTTAKTRKARGLQQTASDGVDIIPFPVEAEGDTPASVADLSPPQLPALLIEGEPPATMSPSSTIELVSGDVSAVTLVGSYDLPEHDLEALRQDKRVVLTLMKQDVRSYFARAAIMHRMAARFDGREEGIACLAREFGFSEKHCDNCLNLHEAFGNEVQRFEVNLIPATVGYEIAKCDAAFKQLIFDKYEKGEAPTVEEVKILRRDWSRKERPAKPAPGPSFKAALDTHMPIAIAKTTENLVINLQGAAAEIDRALIPKKGGGYRLAPVEQLAGNLQSYCECAYKQLTVLVRPLHRNERYASTQIYVQEGSLADKGLVALLVVTEKLSKVRKLKINEQTPWIVGVAAPILRWAAGGEVDGIEVVFDDAFTAMDTYEREMLKIPVASA